MPEGISVIIPTYNREQFIAEAIQSVLDQHYSGSLEIIISDDGSTDNTRNIVASFNHKITFLKKPDDCKTQGAASTRNRGIKASTQPFICFLDSDDIYLPGHFNKMISVFKQEPSIGFSFSRSLEFKVENSIKLFKPWTEKFIFKNDVKNPVVSRNNVVNTNSLFFRREVFDKVGLFNEAYSNGEDGDQWMRISEEFEGRFVDHFGSAYRTQHGIYQLTENSRDQIKKCSILIFEEAKKRYYHLEINDSRRIFKINYNLIWLRYRGVNNVKFIFKYLILIIQQPIIFLNILKENYLIATAKKELKNWDKLEKYISREVVA